MFNCSECGETFGPKVKPIRIILQTRPVSYHNEFFVEDEYGNREKREVDSTGTEIVSETLVCVSDAEQLAGIPQTKPPVAQKPRYEFQEKRADPLPCLLVAVAVHNALERVSPTDRNGKPTGKKLSKRAERDSKVAIPVIKAFTELNTNLRF